MDSGGTDFTEYRSLVPFTRVSKDFSHRLHVLKQRTAVLDYICTSVRQEDSFRENSIQFLTMFVTTKARILAPNMMFS